MGRCCLAREWESHKSLNKQESETKSRLNPKAALFVSSEEWVERMASRNEKMTETAQVPQDMPTSPWTETFQNAETFAIQASRHNQRNQQAEGTTDRPAQRHAESDAARPTQDALSEIFNGV